MASSTLQQPAAVTADESEYDLKEDVLVMISNSRLSDFEGDGLAWAAWCRRMAVAALNGDGDTVARMVSIDSSPGSGA